MLRGQPCEVLGDAVGHDEGERPGPPDDAVRRRHHFVDRGHRGRHQVQDAEERDIEELIRVVGIGQCVHQVEGRVEGPRH